MTRERLKQIRAELSQIVFPQGGGLLVQECLEELDRRIPHFECPRCGSDHFSRHSEYKNGRVTLLDSASCGECSWRGPYKFEDE